MSSHDNPESTMEEEFESDLSESIEARQIMNRELSFLFGQEVVEQAIHVDIADLNLNREMMESIAEGVRKLKQHKSNPAAQQQLVNAMSPGARIVLCLWIMDMDLLDKIQSRSYFN